MGGRRTKRKLMKGREEEKDRKHFFFLTELMGRVRSRNMRGEEEEEEKGQDFFFCVCV